MDKLTETRARDIFYSGFLSVCLDENHFLRVVVKMDERAFRFKTQVINVSRDILFLIPVSCPFVPLFSSFL